MNFVGVEHLLGKRKCYEIRHGGYQGLIPSELLGIQKGITHDDQQKSEAIQSKAARFVCLLLLLQIA